MGFAARGFLGATVGAVLSIWRVFGVVAAVAACSACSTVPADSAASDDESARARFLASLPSLPSLPEMSIPDLTIPGTNRQAPEVDHSLEPVIYWRVIEDDILVVHANTYGCTARSNFQLDVKQYHEDIYTVRLNRNAEDLCSEDIPWGIQLGFGFEEIGVPVGGQVILLNPLDNRAWDWNEREPQMVAQR
jgi:hypothetical protein